MKKATDMELTLFLIRHIENPCKDLDGNNIRNFYIREAKRAITKMKNLGAMELLGSVLK